MYILDSDVCIELMRGNMPAVREVLEHTSPRLIKIPAVVRYELVCGALKSAHPEKNLLITETFLAPFETLPFDARCAVAAAHIRADLESKGQKIGPTDLLIAGTAQAHGGVLVTRNTREFAKVGNLALETWDDIEW